MGEEVHTESEQQIHILRKKHQEAMMELQEQITEMSRSKEKVTKENSQFKVHISELVAQIEILSQEKISIRKVVEKLEINIQDYSAKIEQLNKTVIEVSSAKQRLQQEHQESSKRLNEMKLAIETSGLDKNKLGGAIKDLQNNVDALTRMKGQAENTIKNLETQIKSITAQYEEERVLRIELEKMVGKTKDECKDWKVKYEKKARLQQEANVVIKDFEHCQVTIKELNVKIQTSERRCEDIAIKLREMTNLYEKSDKDSKARAQDIVKLANELDRAKMDNEGLKRDKSKLEDELKAFKLENDALKKQLHEVEMANRKLAHDREELARAYKDTDALKIKFEQRVQELELELKKMA